jgi:endonuclease/exonuclease/phosphatase family metal-dependent hydrolase
MIMKRIFLAITICSLLVFCTSASAWDDGGKIKVMTQNQYLGADLAPLLSTKTSTEFNDALISVLNKIAASRIHDRAQRQAAQIAKERPHVVALQEAWRFDCTDLAQSTPGQGCNDPMIAGAFVDQLEETLSALKAQGVKYKAVASVKNLDVSAVHVDDLPAGIPFDVNGFPALLNTIDRDVILIRNDVPARPVNFKKICPTRISLDGCNYQTVINAPIPGGPAGGLPIQRGFVAADAQIGDKHYRIVTTHLELREPDPSNPLSQFYQAAQASELIQTLKATTPKGKSLLLLGDMNSSPVDLPISGSLPLPPPFDNGIIPPYLQFVEAGFIDGWMQNHHKTPGFTCCQAEDLLNKKSELYERIDLVFSRQEPKWVEDMRVVGANQSDKTLMHGPRLWPSDHGGVTAELNFWE